MVVGELHVVQQSKTSGSNSKRITYLFATKENDIGGRIEYENIEENKRDKITLSDEDLINLNELAQKSDYTSHILPDMLAHTIIGHNDKKLGVILMYIGASETEEFRGRIHDLFVGPPGLAKTKLAVKAYELGRPQSRFSSGQGASSGRSITAIIDKEGDSYVLRYGVLLQANGSICVLDEVGALSMNDQRFLHGVMEEGKGTIDSYAFHKELECRTSILGTLNPQHGEWYQDVIASAQIPLRREVIDRYDLIFAFKALVEDDERQEYATKKLFVERSLPNIRSYF